MRAYPRGARISFQPYPQILDQDVKVCHSQILNNYFFKFNVHFKKSLPKRIRFMLFALSTNIRLGWKGLPEANKIFLSEFSIQYNKSLTQCMRYRQAQAFKVTHKYQTRVYLRESNLNFYKVQQMPYQEPTQVVQVQPFNLTSKYQTRVYLRESNLNFYKVQQTPYQEPTQVVQVQPFNLPSKYQTRVYSRESNLNFYKVQ